MAPQMTPGKVYEWSEFKSVPEYKSTKKYKSMKFV